MKKLLLCALLLALTGCGYSQSTPIESSVVSAQFTVPAGAPTSIIIPLKGVTVSSKCTFSVGNSIAAIDVWYNIPFIVPSANSVTISVTERSFTQGGIWNTICTTE